MDVVLARLSSYALGWQMGRHSELGNAECWTVAGLMRTMIL